jgi:hypothetical protein
MSRYGSVTISDPTSLVTRVVQSAEPGDLQDRANAAIASLPAGYVVVGLTLAGAGDGHTFTVTIEAGLAQEVTGGFAEPPIVTCFLASEAEAMLLARQPAGPVIGGIFADTQVAGASKGTRFMGLVVNGTIATAGGGGPLAIGESSVDLSDPEVVTTITTSGSYDTIPRNSVPDPIEVVFPTWTSGDVLEVDYQVQFGQGQQLNKVKAMAYVSLDGGGTWLEMRDSMAEWYAGGGDLPPSLSAYNVPLSGGGFAAVNVTGPVRVRLMLNGGVADQTVFIGNGNGDETGGQTGIRCKRWPASLFVQGPANGLTPIPP